MKEMKLMLLVLLVAVTGCKSSDNSLTLLRAKEWQLKSMTENGKEVKNPQQIPTLVFSDSSAVYGSAGCNRFFGTYEVGEKGKMTFKTGGATGYAFRRCLFKGIEQGRAVYGNGSGVAA